MDEFEVPLSLVKYFYVMWKRLYAYLGKHGKLNYAGVGKWRLRTLRKQDLIPGLHDTPYGFFQASSVSSVHF